MIQKWHRRIAMNDDIYRCVNITNVLNKLNIKKTARIGNNIYVICPFCQSDIEKNGDMKINAINNLYICNNCAETGTSIDLYSKIKHISRKEAYKQLLKEVPVLDNLPYVFNNPVKDEDYRNLVYSNFLSLHTLSKAHIEKLKSMNITEEYAIEGGFKSTEINNKEKKKICKTLQEQGLRLDGIPGFCATRS